MYWAKNNRFKILVWVIIFFVPLFFFLIKYEVSPTNTLLELINTKTDVVEFQKESNIGNANYYNEADGKYYQDKDFTIEANDNTKYLQELFKNEKEVNIPEGNFLCKEQLCIKGKNIRILGVQGKTKIIFDSNVRNLVGKYNIEGYIVNDSHSRIYDEKSAQNITIDGVAFELKQSEHNNFKYILVLANVNGGRIQNCDFITDRASSNIVTLVDLFCCCKNVKIEDCSFINMTGNDKGSCIWVRNLTNSDMDVENTTENISISNCSFKQNSDDEIVALYSSRGIIKNITVENSELYDYSKRNVKVISTYSSNNDYCGTVDNIKLINNKIYSEIISNFIITVGGPNRTNLVSNIFISHNEITVEKSTKDSCKIIYVNDNNTNIKNVSVNNNIINVNGQLPNSTGIYNASTINDNTIVGDLATGINFGKAYKNVIDGAKTGIASPEQAEKNIIYNCKIGISCNKQACKISDNVITLNQKSGICGIEVKNHNSLNGDRAECNNNKVITSNENQYGFTIHSGNVKLIANLLYGPGMRKYENSNANVIDIN